MKPEFFLGFLFGFFFVMFIADCWMGHFISLIIDLFPLTFLLIAGNQEIKKRKKP